jgi:hypothetical protein
LHYFFTPDHTGDYKIAEGQWHPVCLLVTFKHIQFTIIQVKNATVFYQCLQVFRLCEVNVLQVMLSCHGIRRLT